MPVNTNIQQALILKSLMERPHNTIEFRSMDILSPAPRVLELKDQGFWIITTFQEYTDPQGDQHRIGRYVYLPNKDNLTKKGEAFKEELFRG